MNQHNFCPDDSFRAGFFPVSYEEVPCDTSSQGPVVGVLQYDPWSKRQEFSVYCFCISSCPFLHVQPWILPI